MKIFSCEPVYVLNDLSTTPLKHLGFEIALLIMERISIVPWACFLSRSCNTLIFFVQERTSRSKENGGLRGGCVVTSQALMMRAREAFESRRFRRSNPRPMPPAENQSKWRIAGWVRNPDQFSSERSNPLPKPPNQMQARFLGSKGGLGAAQERGENKRCNG